MDLSKNYIPAVVEEKWYKHWLSKNYFKSTPDGRPPFTVVIPPPNVTGVLHMGHTLNETVQDILVRKARMSGFNACWVPGSDHASIATEAKVVEMLKREKNIDKNNLSREEFLKYAFEWKEKYGGIIYNQIERLGCSVDWERVSFTMDDHYYKAVIKVFVDLYNKGLIYRGARMINWDPAAKTALSDEEVEYKDVTGKLYYVKYEVAESGSNAHYIVIATQRPETIMGDTAVCANPNDERYTLLRGKKVIVPLINKEVPVIFDEYVDKDFGTGILKITPAHDINDFNIGLKYNLPVVDTLNEDGTMSEAAQIYIGEDRFVARKKIVEGLKTKGLLVKEEEYTTRLGYSQRTNVVAEPKISTQWFVKMKELAQPALKEVTSGNVKIHPGEKFNATYKYWLENVKDWCISRQLWWGQQIPAWYDEEGNVYVAETEEQASQLATGNGQLTRDEDVLDTWFSSWLWPIEVFNGITEPNNKDINYYYPTSVLVTGQDIIFFWVARMIMAGMEFMKEKPFNDVYFTGMVRDKQGRKMSKQLGNSPDLLHLIHEYGADAVRFGIMISSPAGNDLLFDENSLEQGKYFNNKLWNALKLVKMWAEKLSGDNNALSVENNSYNNSFAIDWFENRLNEVQTEVDNLMCQFRLSEALKTIYSLIWDDFCSWYLEWIKPGFEEQIAEPVYLKTVSFFDSLLQLLHPFMPFITEEIYHLLEERNDDLIVKQFSSAGKTDATILEQGNRLKEIITAIRDARNKHNIRQKETIKLHIETIDQNQYRAIENILAKQINAESIGFSSQPENTFITIVAGKEKMYIEANIEIDINTQKEKLIKDLNYLKGFLNSIDKKLSNDRFVQNAKADVIELERKKKLDAQAKILAIEQTLSAL
ncbi:valine--tRNA ligase [Ginsengibacter hankyongi]|uniref:Valine--tRNA ligase n=1 Tax=Ginsengibacter hankyongi TaxID=2607284 RepID=A0A5J5IK95_9BACT|nr:valine--tRNA ligase [Ginsengibacter hankyongi]KAA9039107.1 valine--tRNA ligase [Ginsengibacter hankyongi]